MAYYTFGSGGIKTSINNRKMGDTYYKKPIPDDFIESLNLSRKAKKNVTVDYDMANTFSEQKTQGITKTKDKIYITSHLDYKDTRIYVYDIYTGKYEGYFTLNSETHAGGITYDEENDIIYVTGSGGGVLVYDNKKISNAINDAKLDPNNDGEPLIDLNTFKKNDNIFITCKVDINEFDDQNSASVYYYDGILYLSTFETSYKGDFKAFKTKVTYDKNGKKKIEYEEVFSSKVPPLTQGIAVTEYDGQKYLITTQSMGPQANGKITVATIDDKGNTETLGFHYVQAGIQGIQIDEYGNVQYISEWGEDHSKAATMEELLTDYDRTDPINEALLRAGGWAYSDLGMLKDSFVETLNWYKDGIVNIATTIGTEAKEFGGCVLDTLEWYKDGIVDIATTVGTEAKEFGGCILDTFEWYGDKISDAASSISSNIEEFTDSVDYIVDNGIDMEEFGGCILDTLSDYGDAISDVGSAISDIMPWNW